MKELFYVAKFADTRNKTETTEEKTIQDIFKRERKFSLSVKFPLHLFPLAVSWQNKADEKKATKELFKSYFEVRSRKENGTIQLWFVQSSFKIIFSSHEILRIMSIKFYGIRV